ncbi:MAG: dTMP kinase [Candidatus Hodarchaeota archaeon]
MLIAFEGIDGSGKTIQSLALKKRIEDQGLASSLFSFPAYETPVGQLIFNHLHDKNQAFALDPQIVSILYATNRMEMRSKILDALKRNQIVICNRYTYSNVAFQGAKVDLENQPEFISWIEELEFKTFQLPRPDLVVLLLLPPSRAARLIAAKKDQTKQGPDQYERNREFLQKVYDIYQRICNSRDSWIPIQCDSGKEILSKEKITNLVSDAVIPFIEKKGL